MTPRQADRIIKNGQPVTVRNEWFGETFTATFIRRDRRSIYCADGGVYDRADLTILTKPNK